MRKSLAAICLALGAFTFLLTVEGGHLSPYDFVSVRGPAAVVLVDPGVPNLADVSGSFGAYACPSQNTLCDYLVSFNQFRLADYNSRILHRLKISRSFAVLCNPSLISLHKQNIPHRSSSEDSSVI